MVHYRADARGRATAAGPSGRRSTASSIGPSPRLGADGSPAPGAQAVASLKRDEINLEERG